MPKVRAPFMFDCQMCGREFQFGHHIYDGKFIPAYQLHVCQTCFEGNWDGWAPHHESRLIARLKAKGIEVPKRNREGYLPRGL